jgi:subtilisin family serine protease
MPIKVLDDTNFGLYSWWAAGIDFAVTNGAKVINLSAGGSTSSSALSQSILQAIEAGVIFVSITHNDGTGTITFPGRMPESITVGATGESDNKAFFSNWGPEIDLVAPGVNFNTVGNDGTLTNWFGTSFAAPLVSGVACLITAARPALTQAEMHTLLCASAEDEVGGILDSPGFDVYFGWGRLNADYALALAQTEPMAGPVATGGVETLQWSVPDNAASRNPYDVEYSSNLTDWISIESPTNLVYVNGTAAWTDDGTETSPGFLQGSSRNYRLEIQCR